MDTSCPLAVLPLSKQAPSPCLEFLIPLSQGNGLFKINKMCYNKVQAKPCLETFSRFPQLPTELRLQIWEMALLNLHPRPNWVKYFFCDVRYHILPSKKLIDALLSVNQESRQQALGFYDIKLPIYRIKERCPQGSWVYKFEIRWCARQGQCYYGSVIILKWLPYLGTYDFKLSLTENFRMRRKIGSKDSCTLLSRNLTGTYISCHSSAILAFGSWGCASETVYCRVPPFLHASTNAYPFACTALYDLFFHEYQQGVGHLASADFRRTSCIRVWVTTLIKWHHMSGEPGALQAF